jgi:hypothetical protein
VLFKKSRGCRKSKNIYEFTFVSLCDTQRLALRLTKDFLDNPFQIISLKDRESLLVVFLIWKEEEALPAQKVLHLPSS